MSDSSEEWDGDDELARQRRKREARLLDQRTFDFQELTLADLVADVLAAIEMSRGPLDIRAYLAGQGHGWRTIEAVVGHLRRQYLPESQPPSLPST